MLPPSLPMPEQSFGYASCLSCPEYVQAELAVCMPGNQRPARTSQSLHGSLAFGQQGTSISESFGFSSMAQAIFVGSQPSEMRKTVTKHTKLLL